MLIPSECCTAGELNRTKLELHFTAEFVEYLLADGAVGAGKPVHRHDRPQPAAPQFVGLEYGTRIVERVKSALRSHGASCSEFGAITLTNTREDLVRNEQLPSEPFDCRHGEFDHSLHRILTEVAARASCLLRSRTAGPH